MYMWFHAQLAQKNLESPLAALSHFDFSFYVQDMHLPIVTKENKEDRIKILVDYFSSNRNNHTFYAIKFFGCEVLNFVNVLGQIYFMDFFLGGT